MASPGYDYNLSGYVWSNPARITYSIAPDGVFWDHGANDLSSTLNSRVGGGVNWQRQIARALATWQSVANINIVPTNDGSYDFNYFGYPQGDPHFGDIRFGGYAFPGNSTTLAQTYFPPPNGSTAAGDVEVNTSMNFGVGSGYDIYSVLLHETGHSLGLEHPSNPAVVMAPNYGGVRSGLTPGDIAGIQQLYSARRLDAYQANGMGLGFSSAIDVSAGLSTANQTTISAVSLTQIGDTEYFAVLVPSYASGSLQITAGASGASMLSPEVSIYDGSGNILTRASNPQNWSNDVTASVAGVVPGRRYYVGVTGATKDFFDTGSYRLVVALPGSSPPKPPTTTFPPITPPPVPPSTVIVPDRFEPNNSTSKPTRLGRTGQAMVNGLTFTANNDVDFFAFTAGRGGSYQITASAALIQVLNARGRFITQGYGQVMLGGVRAGTGYVLRLVPADQASVGSYALSIGPRVLAASRRKPAALLVGKGSRVVLPGEGFIAEKRPLPGSQIQPIDLSGAHLAIARKTAARQARAQGIESTTLRPIASANWQVRMETIRRVHDWKTGGGA